MHNLTMCFSTRKGFQLIFYYITKHKKITYFLGIHFPKKTTFQQNKQGLTHKLDHKI